MLQLRSPRLPGLARGLSSLGNGSSNYPWWKQQAANVLTGSRLAAAPVLSYWISQGEFGMALGGLAAAAVTDGADGYVARKFSTTSTLGSYLDPVADKVLIGCSTVSLGLQGVVPLYAAAIVVSRDVLLIAGGGVQRVRQLRSAGRVVSTHSFLDLSGVAPMNVRPMLISKLNTVAQLAMVGTGMLHGYSAEYFTADIVNAVSATAAGTTFWSGSVYMYANVLQTKNPLYVAPSKKETAGFRRPDKRTRADTSGKISPD